MGAVFIQSAGAALRRKGDSAKYMEYNMNIVYILVRAALLRALSLRPAGRPCPIRIKERQYFAHKYNDNRNIDEYAYVLVNVCSVRKTLANTVAGLREQS